jgi:peptide/nickel transport system substrate-binding protein
LLQEAGYKGEKVVLMTTKEYPQMYNTALVMQQQLKAAGINAELAVMDWPTALQKSMTSTEGWNFFFTGWTTTAGLGGAQSLRNLADPADVFKPPGNKSDPAFMAAFTDITRGTTIEARRDAFAKAQARALEMVMAIPLGVLPEVQAIRANVQGYKPYWSPRLTNVWLQN